MNPLARFGTSGLAGLLGGNQGALFPYLGAIGALLLHLGGQQGGQQQGSTQTPPDGRQTPPWLQPPTTGPTFGTPPVLPPWAVGTQQAPPPLNPLALYQTPYGTQP